MTQSIQAAKSNARDKVKRVPYNHLLKYRIGVPCDYVSLDKPFTRRLREGLLELTLEVPQKVTISISNKCLVSRNKASTCLNIRLGDPTVSMYM